MPNSPASDDERQRVAEQGAGGAPRAGGPEQGGPPPPQTGPEGGAAPPGGPGQGGGGQAPAAAGQRAEGQAPAAGEAPPATGQQPATEAEVEQLRARIAELEDLWKRALADLDNYRKRAQRDIDRRVEEQRESLLREFLNTVDVVERALQISDPGNPLYEGLRALLEQLEATLQRHGVMRLGAAGEPFDPVRHEAVAVRETTEVPDRTIVEVMRSGWALGDRVLRPAQVVVARSPERAE